MSIRKNVSFAIVLILLMPGILFAQTSVTAVNPNPTTAVKSEPDFVSVEGGFTIALPKQISSYSPNEKVEGVIVGGSAYKWNIPQGFFMVSFYERAFIPENPQQMLERIGGILIEDATGNGDSLISKKAISIDGSPGLEIRMRLKKGTIGIARYYSVKNLTFFLSSGWNESESGETQLKILDSFKLIDKTAVLAKMVEEATPKPLPQSPLIKKLKTDAEDDRLKGKVKSVLTTSEDLTGTWAVSGIKKSTEDIYNENGFRTKHIAYDYKGLPMGIVVYGFIDAMRVSSSGSLSYEYDPPIMIMATPTSKEVKKPVIVKPFDSRYGTKYEYKYNEKGQLVESVRFHSNGELANKTVYVYSENKIEISSSYKDGKVYSKSIEIYDEKSNLIERIYVSTDPKIPDSKYTFSYPDFDEKGNWTKRIIFAKDGSFDGSFKDQHYIEYRTITYYP